MRPIVTALLLSASVIASHAQTPIPKENLISYWTGEPVGGGSGMRADEIGSNHLWGPSESLVVAGVIGNATVLDGSGALRCNLKTDTYASGLQTVGREITYAGWIQVDSLQDDQVIVTRWSRWAPARQFKLTYVASSGVLQLAWADSGAAATQTIADDLVIAEDTWYFVAFGRSDAANRIWLSVTSGADTAPRTAVTRSPAPTNPVAENGEVWFWYDQGAKTNQYGKWDEWAVYNTTLGTGELTWLFNGGAGRTYGDFVYVVEPTLGFFHDMEQEEPASGRISYYSYSEPNAFLSSEQAASGSQSLKITGSWGQIQLFNDSNTDYWCPIDRCRVSMDVYMVDFVGSMLFQMDGKTTTVLTEFDTNEGLGVMFSSRDGERGFSMGSARTSGYNLPLNQWVHIDYLRDRTRTAPDNAIELYVDGELVLAVEGQPAPYTPAPYVARTWHHISLGNDRIESPTFYIDNFEVAPEPWGNELAVRPMGTMTATVGDTVSLDPTVTGAAASAVYAWIRTSGSDSLVITMPAAAQTDVIVNGAGIFELQLTVIDSGDTATGTVSIDVSPATVPYDSLALAAMDSITAVEGETLDVAPVVTGGSGPRTYEWTRVSGPDSVVFGDAAVGTTTVRFDAPGSYVLQLQVMAGTDTVTGTVTAAVSARSGIAVPGQSVAGPRVTMSANPVQTGIRFITDADISGLVIYDRTGRIMHIAGSHHAGVQHVEPLHGAITWDGQMMSGRPAPSGTYFYRITTDAGTTTGSFVKIR